VIEGPAIPRERKGYFFAQIKFLVLVRLQATFVIHDDDDESSKRVVKLPLSATQRKKGSGSSVSTSTKTDIIYNNKAKEINNNHEVVTLVPHTIIALEKLCSIDWHYHYYHPFCCWHFSIYWCSL
jgi:hypothetical protein